MIIVKAWWHYFRWWWLATHPFEDRLGDALVHKAEYDKIIRRL